MQKKLKTHTPPNVWSLLKSKADFIKYVDTLLGYCPAEIAVVDVMKTKWYKFCTLPTDSIELDTHPTLPQEITCVFQLLDWEAILKHIGDKGSLSLVDPFAGIDENILTHLQLLLAEHHPTLLQKVISLIAGGRPPRQR